MDEAERGAIERRAKAGEPEAAVDLALSLLAAEQNQRRDLSRAHRLLRDASQQGVLRAIRLRAALLATGTGCPEDRAGALKLIQAAAAGGDQRSALELILLSRMAGHRPGPVERLSTEPLVERHSNFLSGADCNYLMTLAEPQFAPSLVIDPVSGERRPDPVRTSDGMSFGPLIEDLVVNAINRRIAAATGTPYGAGEPLHLLRYRPGQQYRPHSDALPNTANQRTKTAILYLNDNYEGGETEFPLLGIKLKATAGDMLVFSNADTRGVPLPLSRHCGLPVTNGVKYIATRWIRSKRYHPWS
jgi:prolyl 4-hydroxylase